VTGSGESWKAYLHSANGRCDDTVHGYYWNDDQPMMYFQDVRDRPRYRASHVVPLEELGSDLANPATTPDFASVGVKAGYQDATPYTHYSLLRTIEAALGLGTLTANDRYAQPPASPPSPGAWHLSPPRPWRRQARLTSSPARQGRPSTPATTPG
jgi:hypothetical protein